MPADQPLPPPVLGLHRDKRATGESYLVGVVPRDAVLEAGMRVELRRLRPEAHEDCGAEFVIVFLPTKRRPS